MTKSGFKEKIYQFWYILLIPILGIIFFIIAHEIVNSLQYPNSGFLSYWLAGRFTALGQNPYSTELWIGGHHQFGASWISNTTFIYPLPLALFFSPLGLFPLYQAYVVWVLVSQFMIISSVALMLKSYSNLLIKNFILPLLSGVVLFRPTIFTLVNGQVSGLLLLVIAGIVFLWEKEKWWQGTVLLSLISLKPNLGVPIIVLLSVYLILKKQIISIVMEGACAVLLFIIVMAHNPNWIIEFMGVENTKLSLTFGYSPTVWACPDFFVITN